MQSVNSNILEHVRISMNSVHNAIYETSDEFDGHNVLYYESQIARSLIVNGKFPSRKYKYKKVVVDDSVENITDQDTLSTRSTARKKLNQTNVMSLNLVADRLVEAKSEEATLTHVTDSTTRKHVGSLAPAGIHVNTDEYIPLPTLNIASEITANIADGIHTDFKILAAASRRESSDLYYKINIHVSDSTAHNKGLLS